MSKYDNKKFDLPNPVWGCPKAGVVVVPPNNGAEDCACPKTGALLFPNALVVPKLLLLVLPNNCVCPKGAAEVWAWKPVKTIFIIKENWARVNINNKT